MKYFPLLILSFSLLLSSCKSEFEKLRTSSDVEAVHKAAMKYYKNKEYAKAQTLFEIAIPYKRGQEDAEDMYYKYANTHYYLKDYILASHYFKNFATTYYNSENKEEAEFMSAFSKYRMSPNERLDQTSSIEAIDAFQTFTNSYPNSPRVSECNNLIDELRSKLEEKSFQQGKLYHDLGRFDSSIRSFENMLKDFPDAEKAEDARYLILKSSYLLAKNSIYEKKEERFENCVQKYELFAKKYSNSKYIADAEKINTESIIELKKFKNVRYKNSSTESGS